MLAISHIHNRFTSVILHTTSQTQATNCQLRIRHKIRNRIRNRLSFLLVLILVLILIVLLIQAEHRQPIASVGLGLGLRLRLGLRSRFVIINVVDHGIAITNNYMLIFISIVVL